MVLDVNDSALDAAVVVAADSNSVGNADNPVSYFYVTTNSSGRIPAQNVTEFMANGTHNWTSGYLYFSNYTINATSTDGYFNNASLNATSRTDINISIANTPGTTPVQINVERSGSGGGAERKPGFEAEPTGGDCIGVCISYKAYIPYITPENPVKLEVSKSGSENESIPIENIEIEVRETVARVDITISRSDEPENKAPGNVYSYIEINHTNLENEDVKIAKIGFSVNGSWIEENGADPESVVLYRYSGIWRKLKTELLSEEGGIYNYQSETPGFSTFAISVEKSQGNAAENAEPREPSVEEITNATMERIAENMPVKTNHDWYVFFGLTAMAVAFIAYMTKHGHAKISASNKPGKKGK